MLTIQDWRNGRRWISMAVIVSGMLLVVFLVSVAGVSGGAESAVIPHPERILSAGVSHTCGLRPDGGVHCWGEDDFGQSEDHDGPFSQVSAGWSHTCGLDSAGRVDCWGASAWVEDQAGPFTQISVGYYFACGLTTDGIVKCWGYNAEYRAGSFTQLSSGLYHTCALSDDGSVECWRSGSGDPLENQTGPFSQINTGWWHACGLRADGSAGCWGSNNDGSGNYVGQAEDRPGPFSQVSAGGFHTCGLKPDGSVACWGLNDDGQAEAQDGPFTQISAGYRHVCGLKDDRSVECWGNNLDGQAEHQDGPFGPHPQIGSPITRVSTDQAGNQANDHSWAPDISADGRYVTFVSNAYNLWNGERDEHSLRVKDLLTGEHVSGVHGYQGDGIFKNPTISRDGLFVAYEAYNQDGYGPQGIGLLDRQQSQIFSISNADEFSPSISDDGYFVAFEADTPDLVSGDDNNMRDVFVYDHHERTIDIISVTTAEDGTIIYGDGDSYDPSISADGRYITFKSEASSLVSNPCSDYWWCEYILVHDRWTGKTAVVAEGSVNEDIFVYNPGISADGKYVAYGYDCTDWGPTYCANHIAVKEWQTGDEWMIKFEEEGITANYYYDYPSISADGNFVTFYSDYSYPSGVFIYDHRTDKIRPISVDIKGTPGNGNSHSPTISADGQRVVFASEASNLVDDDTNSSQDIFVYDGLLHDGPLGDKEGIVSAGEYHTCALKSNGKADCWGAAQIVNDHGQAEDQIGPFVQVGAGAIHSCGLRTDGSVDCWGTKEWYGQGEDQSGPFSQISVGGNHNCGLRPDGSVDCWGGNWSGQAEDQIGPYVQISAGWQHTCGLGPDGAIGCWGVWGANELDQAEEKAGSFAQVSVGWGHTCGLMLNGSVDCWGQNEDGQAVDQTGPFIQISAGGRHTCGLKGDGSVECWGFNSDGQAEDQAGPFVQISTGGTWMGGPDRWGHTCGLRPDGRIDCWGSNKDGQAEDQAGRFGPFGPSILMPLILGS